MSIFGGVGRTRWGTIATLLLVGIVMIFILSIVASLLKYTTTAVYNVTSYIRQQVGVNLNETVTLSTIAIQSEFGNASAVVAQPVNEPFKSLSSHLNWIATVALTILSNPMLFAAIIVITMIAIAIALRG